MSLFLLQNADGDRKWRSS
nr:hypothetical protein [Nostoc sp. 'Peltigera membranacea cyanobiont' 213]